MNQFLFVLLIASATSGCTAIKPTFYEDINELGQTKSATVTLTSGIVLEVVGLRVDADSTRWLTPEDSSLPQENRGSQSSLIPTSTPTSVIETIVFPSKRTGFFKGARNGLIIGAGFGAIEGYLYEKRTGYACTNPEPGNYAGLTGPGCQAALAAVSSGVIMGILGAGVGAVFGGLLGKGKNVYRLQSDLKKN